MFRLTYSFICEMNGGVKMKKLTALLVALLTASSLSALYNGNPSEPELIDKGFFLCRDNMFSVKAGYQGDFVFDRKLRAHRGATGRIDTFKYDMQQGVLTFGLMDRYEVYGSLGSMNAYIAHRPHIDMKRREYETSNHLTWGCGARAIIFRACHAVVGLDAKYQYAHPHVKWNALDGAAFTTGAGLQYREWQLGLAGSYHVHIFTPYAAVKYSSVHSKLNEIRANMLLGHERFKMRSRDRFGMALGCSLSTAKLLDLNVEVSLFDEQALILAGNIKL
jgi:major outer membrane protein